MEFLFELSMDIIFEGVVQIGSSKKVPMPLRVLATIISVAIFVGLALFFFVCGIGFANKGNIGAACLFIGAGLLVFIGFIYMSRKAYKENNNDDDDDRNKPGTSLTYED